MYEVSGECLAHGKIRHVQDLKSEVSEESSGSGSKVLTAKQVLVLSIYHGKPFWVYHFFDPHPSDLKNELANCEES